MSEDKVLMNFSNIILSYAVNATIHLGLSPDPSTGQISIDLKEKTENNLTEDEEKIMSETLSNLKSLYVNALDTKKEEKK